MKKPVIAAIAALTLAAVALTPTVGATDSVVVGVLSCAINGGTTTVPAGAPITIRGLGWSTGTYGEAKDFLLKQRTTLTISRNGTSTAYDLSHQWPAPQFFQVNTIDNAHAATGFWFMRLPDTDLGVSLASGESVLATWNLAFTHPVIVAWPPVGPVGDEGPFLVRADDAFPASCLITAG